ncbi:DUF1972 domain-containing protein [Sphingomonas sp. DT-51]|uniref:DUF1972 domain-containing protein n=1 Tax=Sphingomonas sp. DT-51 TaxID=3396165 RepID=UPI003F1958C2
MKVAVIGTVGVPARYGGFETLAEQLATGIAADEAQLVMYCQRSAYPELIVATPFCGHQRVLVPLSANGAASLVHDVLAMLHAALIARVDAALILGYSGAWFLPVLRLLRPSMRVVTNVDGMEWRRAKFGGFAKRVLKVLERLAIRFSHRVIADNDALVALVRDMYGAEATMIAYGGDHTIVPASSRFALAPGYALSVARIEPENNSHLILEACAQAAFTLVAVGNWDKSDYGRELKQRYADHPQLLLLDPVYDVADLAGLRAGAAVYVHGHSVGGTNPSLVEAIYHHNRLLAYDCAFNRSTLGQAGSYFKDVSALRVLLSDPTSGMVRAADLATLKERYRWHRIVSAYVHVLNGGQAA